MGKITLATRLADEAGTSVQKASRFIDDVGAGKARTIADDLAQRGSRTVKDWAKPATIGAGAIGGGGLVWRQQDVERARALAEQQQSYQETIASIMDSDLPAEMKQDMVDDASNAASNDGDGSGGSGGGGGSDGLIPDDPQTLIILVIVMAIVLKTTLGDE